MKYDNNKHRNDRSHQDLEPVFRQNPEVEQREFEDQALDNCLQVFAVSRHDGDAFLERVNARLEGGDTAETGEQREEEQSFFGLSPSLWTQPEPPYTGDSKPIEAKTENNKRHSIALVLISATALLLIGFSGWQTFGAGAEDDSTSHVQVDPDVNLELVKNKAASLADAPAIKPTTSTAVDPLPVVVEALPPKNNELPVVVDEVIEPAPEVAYTTTPEKVGVELATEPEVDPFWHFKLEFGESNEATAWIGKRKIQDRIPLRGSDVALKTICHEISKQVHYYSPILAVEWQGKISVSGSDFYIEDRFNGIDEMFDVGIRIRGQLREQISRLDKTEQPQPAESVTHYPLHNRLNGIHDHILKESLAVTDKLLQANLDPKSASRNPESVLYKNFEQLNVGEFLLANKEEILGAKRDPKDPFRSFDEFHQKSTAQLKVELEQTPQFDLFDDYREFKTWRDKIVRQNDLSRLKAREAELHSKLRNQATRRTIAKKYQKQIDIVEQKIANSYDKFGTKNGRSLDLLNQNHVDPLISLLRQKPGLNGFTLAMGDECHLCESDAKTLDGISKDFGGLLARFDNFGSRDPERIDPARLNFLSSKIRSVAFHDDPDQAIGTIDQMLQIENTDIRLELINALGRLDTSAACRLLACYAKYDVEPEVRIAATDALRTFPTKMSRAELLEGFSYPWPDAARHAAEAIVRLNDTGSVPELVELLDKPDPRTPRKQDDGIFEHREMVSINHLRNCLLCHQDSQSPEDRGRGVVPSWRSPLPRQYYADRNPEFARVRADITYLRQDFSLIRKVKNHGRWPANQRFDYVARTKEVSFTDADKIAQELRKQPNLYHASIDQALRQLTQKSPSGTTSKAWKAALDVPGT